MTLLQSTASIVADLRLSNAISKLSLLFLAVVCLYLVNNRYKSGLKDIPGPIFASISSLWYFIHCIRREHTKEWELHQRYRSKLVRIGPNMVSCADPAGLKLIYGLKRVFPKVRLIVVIRRRGKSSRSDHATQSIHYRVQNQFSTGGVMTQNISAVLDEPHHARMKRAVANAYAMTSLVEFEPLIDSTSTTFVNEIATRFADQGSECPLHDWLQMYAFDIMYVLLIPLACTRPAILMTVPEVANSPLASSLDFCGREKTSTI